MPRPKAVPTADLLAQGRAPDSISHRSLMVWLRPERLLVAPGSVGLALLLDLPEQMAQVGLDQALEVEAENPAGELAPPREAAGQPGAPPAAASQG